MVATGRKSNSSFLLDCGRKAMVILSLSFGQADFEDLLGVRDFDAALEMARGSDSLTAVVYAARGDYSAAADLYELVFRRRPTAGTMAALWRSIAGCEESPSSLSLRGMLSEWGGRLSWGPSDLLSLIESSSALGDSVVYDSLTAVLIERFPESEETYQIIGWDFYDRLYPVWNDDSARISVLREFIDRRGDESDAWRCRAWRYTLTSVLQTADSSSWKDYYRSWKESCPNDPQCCLTGATLMMDRDSSWSEALELCDRGLEILEGGYHPQGMPAEEWMLSGPALDMRLRFRRLMALDGSGRRDQALALIRGVIEGVELGIDDYHTETSLYWLQGEMLLKTGYTIAALRSYARSAALGNVENEWSGKAVSAMEGLLIPRVGPIKWARESTGYDGPTFADVTGILGPDSLVRGTRISWCDYNDDGYPDLLLGHDLYRNDHGTGFTDVTVESGLSTNRGNGGVWGDLNLDGTQDLVTSGDTVQIFLQRDGTLEESTDKLGVLPTDSRVEGVALLDWNADGWLDLYLASYERSGNLGSGTADAFYLGRSNGFVEVSDSLGMTPFLGKHLCGRGVSPCDYDMDGDMDILVSNYRLQENLLWENRDGRAVNSALAEGVAGTNTQGWWGHTIGSTWGDYDNDGDWDLFSANLAHPRYITFSDRSMLYENVDSSFEDVRAALGIRFEETHSNPVWGDFDNDGWLDLFVTSVYPERRSFLYLNEEGSRFRDVTWMSGSRVFNGWGAAAADFNLDGRLDLAVGSGDGPVLLMNTTPEGCWMEVEVVPTSGINHSGIGCIVALRQNDLTLLRQVEGGSGTTSQNGGILHFGLPCGDSCTLELYVPGDTDAVAEKEAVPDRLVRIRPN
ncbi:hypothetical protein GF402_09930 [Candidatus Fermentibacteria bacterium]|nr:hypothetical protein [Candidatus Fermentibacteria bacterium]